MKYDSTLAFSAAKTFAMTPPVHTPGVCDCMDTAPQPSGWVLLSGPYVHWKDCPKGARILNRKETP